MSIFETIFDLTPTGMIVNAITKETIGPAWLNLSDQAANIDAIDVFFGSTQALNSEATRIKDEWMQWVSSLSWYQKHADEGVGAEAFNRRNAFMRANALPEERESVDEFLKKVPVVDPVTGKINHVTSTGDRVVPPKPLIPTQYKVVAVATAAGVSVLVVLKKLHIL